MSLQYNLQSRAHAIKISSTGIMSMIVIVVQFLAFFHCLLHRCIAFHQPIAVPLSASSPLYNDNKSNKGGNIDYSDTISINGDNTNEQSSLSSRRHMLRRILVGSALLASASQCNTRKVNALDNGSNIRMMPNVLMSSEENERGVKGMPVPSKKLGGLINKIRSVSKVMDELQRDLMQERWDLVEEYPNQLRSYVPLFTAYTDSAFPTDIPTDKGLRVALRYEVGRFFASLERFRQATNRKALDEAYIAYSDMSLHFDRYLRVGGLYTFYDDNISLEPYYVGNENSLIYADPKKDPALVRDLIVLIQGPEKGKTGIVIGIYMDGSDACAVKLDRNKGIREIRIVPRSWAAKRLGEQDPDDVFLIPRNS